MVPGRPSAPGPLQRVKLPVKGPDVQQCRVASASGRRIEVWTVNGAE